MTILTVGDNITICADEKDIQNGVKHFFILSGGSYFNGDTFKNEAEGGRRLRENRIAEFKKLCPKATKEFYKKREEMQMQTPKGGDALTNSLNKMLVEVLANQSADAIFAATMPRVRERITKEFGILPQIHEIKTPTETHRVKGVTHEKYETVLNLIAANIPVFLTGAAGTGKNVICKQVAEGLGLDFYFTNAVTQEYKLTGFIDANGNYHDTQFYQAFKNGGLFFLDEMDGSIPEVLIVLNAALANGYFDFPTGKVNAHENFRVIAAGNTFGTGADMEYTGRYQLDAASLDRFALVEVNYSPRIEKAISGDDGELCEFIRAFRKATTNAGIKHLATYRSIERIHKLSGVMDLAEVLKISLLKNLQKDDINIIKDEMKLDKNKYFNAMCTAW